MSEETPYILYESVYVPKFFYIVKNMWFRYTKHGEEGWIKNAINTPFDSSDLRHLRFVRYMTEEELFLELL